MAKLPNAPISDAAIRAAFMMEAPKPAFNMAASVRSASKPKISPRKAPRATLSAYKPTLGEKIQDGIASGLGALGVSDRYANHFAGRAIAPLNDLTPVGDAMSFADAGTAFKQGRYGAAAGNLALGAIGSVPGLGDAAAPAAKAMFLGVMAKNADKVALRKAEQLAAQGADRGAIWNQTGWFKGADDKWRFEIDDSKSGLRRDRLKYEPNGGRSYTHGKLGDAIEHPELFKAYPDAENVDFAEYSFRNGGTDGSYYPPSGGMEQVALWNDSGRSTALHETQHLVQNREGFASGGNWQGLDGQFPNPQWDQWAKPENRAIADQYSAVFTSPDYLSEREAWNTDWAARFAPRLDALEGAQDAAGRSGFKDFEPQIAALFEEAEAYERATYPTLRRAAELSESGIVKEPSRHIPGGEAYRRLAGEVEARNVQKRLDFDTAQRRATPPWATQDVPDSEQIVRFSK